MTLAALLALGLLAYTYLGYPLVAVIWARLAPHQLRDAAEFEPTITICLTVFDGGAFLRAKLLSLQRLEYPAHKVEILIASDASLDNTDAIALQFAAGDPRIHLFSSPMRVGKPSLLNRLLLLASGDVLLMTDVRQPLAPGAARALVAPLRDASVGAVSGSLVLTGTTGPGLYWRYEAFIRRAEGRIGRMVGVTGGVYAVRRVDFPELPADIILDDAFVPLRIALTRRRVVFASAAEAYDEAFGDQREFARKVRTLAGNYQLLARLPRLLVPVVNPAWFQLSSHKVMRLLCPWALLVLLPSSIFASLSRPASLEVELCRGLALAQILCYLLALLGGRAGRIAGAARTFVVLNAAAIVGLWRFLRRQQAVTW